MMSESTYAGFTLGDILVAVGFLIGFLVLAWLFSRILSRAARKIAAGTRTALDNMLVDALCRPLVFGLILAGLYLGGMSLPLRGRPEEALSRGGTAAFAVLGICAGLMVVDALLRWYRHEISPKTKSSLDERLVYVLRRGIPLIAGILALFLVLDISGIDLPPVRRWLADHGGPLGVILLASLIALFTITQIGPRIIRATAARRMKDEPEEEVTKRAETLAAVVVTTAQVIIIAVAFFMILSEIGINIAPILTGVGVVGIAVGFGAQTLVRDIIAGLFIIMENQYRVGDVVRIADVSGLVESVNLRRTVLRDLDGIVHTVPNGEARVTSNFTKELSRVNLNVSVAYGEDLDRVIGVMNSVGQGLASDPAWASLILTPPQVLRVDNLGDSGIEIKMVGDTKPLQQWAVMGELRKRLKKAFDEAGIEIPWPHTKVYFGNAPPSSN